MTTFQLDLLQMNGDSQGWSNHIVRRASKLNLANVFLFFFCFFLLSC